ncbi:alanyl-tRNA editing protein [Halobaculum magnesiiphilum]|uniref:Alanyl-tRNA editing protein n=1 Tax=Halobaculum magnesiiphilum TaxID=1017351 RepID=A0A8T8WBI4_9EURY|nr:alanyl-tRNA editing protein [Halobaculum magnesiiphilum]QZP37186.1 alanyl-tRNA editing protein [Halobaculum magnesiiphilum]
MTEQLYLADSTVGEFEATVERALDERVVLDRTHFYPTGGGQPNDTGTLRVLDGGGDDADRDGGDANRDDGDGGGAEVANDAAGDEFAVTDVEKTDTVYHHLDGAAPPEGARVRGVLDWDRRHALMRYHTAQHLLSAVLLDEFDARTVGNQLYVDRARLDAEYPKFSETDLADIEARMNALVDDALPVRHYTMDREVAEAELDTERTRIDLLPSSITELRIVEIGGARSAPGNASGEGTDPRAGDADAPFDRTACAGTHVDATDAIGEVTVEGRTTQGGEKERVEFTLADT